MSLNPPDIKELRAIVDWVNLTEDVRELSIKYGDVELFVSRDGAPSRAETTRASVSAPAPAPALENEAVAEVPPSAPAATDGASFESSSTTALAANEITVTAPMVGVFYSAPKPGDPPFVSVGDQVHPDTVVGIVEVMKLMNSLEAKAEGTVTKILVQNEQAVEFGQPLMVITRNG
ncbi:acetyl-CoA carboxylase biotin carboxyl carrier protein [Microbacterium sp. LRZ72]|uniref:acetyl-CoA carboxylase biotin carboxyl carrier protein n=1 Tax=Microbacterium sp. LRZ72 TaxID=2942481 RepID=UPI0029BEA3BF|nr:acetyl-CoA carboxylase biotin carboxyl carrier protein [Microbacterium sp. LRZ72]MDX2378014.1 acetyl-CoA carboxylase biotin carboxyl carrier protein [Microbacterium sp. LRZ72]